MGSYYPVLLDLRDQPVLVVGGGRVAERKVGSLLEAAALVTVISPTVSAKIKAWRESGKIIHYNRTYAVGDVQRHYRIVFSATNEARVNDKVASEAKAKGLFVNVASEQQSSSMIDPATLHRGKLQIAVSTSGASPTIAANIIEELEKHYGEEYERVLDFLYALRVEVKKRFTKAEERKVVLRSIAELDWLQHFRQEEAEESIPVWIQHFAAQLASKRRVEGKDECS